MTAEQTLQLAVESLTRVNKDQTRLIEEQSAQIATITAQNTEMSLRIKELMAQLAYFQRRMFGRSSEKHLNLDNQPSLFDAVGIEIPSHTSEDNTDVDDEAGQAESTTDAGVSAKRSRKGLQKSN